MKRTLLISVAALALTAGGNLAYSQGAGGNTPMANPAGPSGGAGAGASGGATMKEDAAPGTRAPAKGAQDRAIPEKQKSTQLAPTTKQSADDKGAQPSTRQSQDGKAAPSTRQSSDDKAGQPATRQSQDGKAAPSTRQSSDDKAGQPTTRQSQGQQPAQGTQQQTQSPATGGSKQGTTAQGSGSMTSKSVSLTTEQKTTIRQTVLTGSAPRVTNVNFSIRVGTVVPRTVRVAPLPATIIEIEPEWRGYMYFVYNDEIIVVEPRTLRIVAVIEV